MSLPSSRRDRRAATPSGAARGIACWFPVLGLVLLNLCVFGRTWSYGFFEVDDHVYVTANPHVLDGLSRESVAWAFRPTGYGANWVPLTWLSLMLDAELFGGAAAGFHLTNVVLHTLSSLLLLAVLSRLTGALWRSFVVSCLFAVHPLHVESVVWISERKDVLSTLLGLGALWTYASYAVRPGFRWYALTLLLLALSLLSKQMLVTLPCLLLLLDFWPLGRLGGRSGAPPSAAPGIGRLILEKLPFVALSGIFSLAALWAQAAGGAVQSWDHLPLAARVANAAVSYVQYLRRTFWPVDLAVYYPHPLHGLPAWQVAASAAVLVVLTAAAVRLRRRRPYLFVGWFWYLIALLPVIGLIQVGGQASADRYTYVPLIGVFVAVVWLACDYLPAARWRIFAASSAIAAAAVAGWVQVGYWRDSETLLRRAIAVTRDNGFAHAALGGVLLSSGGDWSEAEGHLRAAIRLQPDNFQAHYNLALLLSERGLLVEANEEFRRTLELQPEHVKARLLLCLNLKRLGAFDELRRELDELRLRRGALPPDVQAAVEALAIP